MKLKNGLILLSIWGTLLFFTFWILVYESRGTKVNLGILKEAKFVTTSFNESNKVQILVDSSFFIVRGQPELKLHDTLWGIRDSKGFLIKVIDKRNKKYTICK